MKVTKYCKTIKDENLTIHAVLDQAAQTFRWALFKENELVDCGDLSPVSQMNPTVFLPNFCKAIFETFKSISVEIRELK